MPKHGFAAACGSGLDPILVLVTPIVFVSYNASASLGLTVNGGITVSCTNVVLDTLPSFTVALSAGTGGSGFAPRKMSFGGQKLSYNLYTSPSYGTVWGDGTGSTVAQPYNAGSSQASQLYTVYAKIPQHQYVPTGVYADVVTISVTY